MECPKNEDDDPGAYVQGFQKKFFDMDKKWNL
jgi:hypothetical protein